KAALIASKVGRWAMAFGIAVLQEFREMLGLKQLREADPELRVAVRLAQEFGAAHLFEEQFPALDAADLGQALAKRSTPIPVERSDGGTAQRVGDRQPEGVGLVEQGMVRHRHLRTVWRAALTLGRGRLLTPRRGAFRRNGVGLRARGRSPWICSCRVSRFPSIPFPSIQGRFRRNSAGRPFGIPCPFRRPNEWNAFGLRWEFQGIFLALAARLVLLADAVALLAPPVQPCAVPCLDHLLGDDGVIEPAISERAPAAQ